MAIHILNVVERKQWSRSPSFSVDSDIAKALIFDKGWMEAYEQSHFVFYPWVEVHGSELHLFWYMCAYDDFKCTNFITSEQITVSEFGALQ